MVETKLFRWEVAGWECFGKTCPRNPLYFDNIIGDVHYIKKGTMCLTIKLSNGGYEIYCKDCIDILYQQLRPVLDSKLWAFK